MPKTKKYLSLVFLVSGASYKALYETLLALILFDSPLSESKVIENRCKRSLVMPGLSKLEKVVDPGVHYQKSGSTI